MTRARVLQEVRPMRVEELYERRQQRSLTMAEAGEMRGVTERTIRRGSGRDHAEGAAGLQARRIGRLSARVVPVDAAQRMVTRADATTEIYSAFFVEAAGTRSRVRGLREGMEPPGRVRSLSPDRGAHDGPTEEAGGPVDKLRLTQGPRTVQDRRPTALARDGIPELAAASRSLPEHVLPQHHTRFLVGATEPGPAFLPGVGPHLAEILCVPEERVVAQDHTVR